MTGKQIQAYLLANIWCSFLLMQFYRIRSTGFYLTTFALFSDI